MWKKNEKNEKKSCNFILKSSIILIWNLQFVKK